MGLGKSLKKAVGKVVSGVSGFLGGKPGPSNPFGAPDTTFLDSTKAFDYLKDPSRYNFLTDTSEYKPMFDTSQYSFLMDTADNPYTASLPESGASFRDFYRAPRRDVGEQYFRDFIGSIDAPSSVDAVRSELDSERLNQILSGIDRDTKQSVGSLKMDFADRGLSGPGQISDIEAAGLAQAYGDSDTRRAEARTSFAQQELDRLKEKEKAIQGAYGTRYGVGADKASQERSIAAQGAMADSGAYNELLRTQAGLGESAAEREQQGAMSYADLLNRTNLSYADLMQGLESQYANMSADDARLFASLVNARDLGKVGVQANLFNAGADRQLAGKTPGLDEYFKRSFGQKLGEQLGGGGGAGVLKMFGLG